MPKGVPDLRSARHMISVLSAPSPSSRLNTPALPMESTLKRLPFDSKTYMKLVCAKIRPENDHPASPHCRLAAAPSNNSFGQLVSTLSTRMDLIIGGAMEQWGGSLF
ncbi:hypothetical protein FB45DRAFT_1021574 [Roridomyces roridus]|uniref:Uncharacterized protein n=1 Tax=Roridomyces roridus TaxID=1738132 RepID=A0AAD7CC91_9AGAR|nr:hypothetical protein FB45DRAFT_1021574 [Roridomyces roridus]